MLSNDPFTPTVTLPSNARAELDDFVRQHKAIKAQIAELNEELETLRAEYAPKIAAAGNYSGSCGKIELRDGYTTTSYQADVVKKVLKRLKDLGLAELVGMLEAAEKKTTVKPTFQVK